MTEKYYRISDVALLFNVSRQMVHTWIKEEKIKAIVIGEKTRRITEKEVKRFKKEREAK